MIYLFTNEIFGRFFIETIHRFALQFNLKVTVVYSTKGNLYNFKSTNPFKSLIRRLAMTFKKYSFRKNTGFALEVIGDINSPAFADRIKMEDHGIVAGFNQIFKKETISRFHSLVNFHPSLLPFYRGPVPAYWCLHYGERSTGLTLHKITDRIDSGEILFQEVLSIGEINDPMELEKKIAESAQPIFWKYLQHVSGNEDRWQTQILDAFTIYKNQIDYLSFPPRG